MFGIHALAIAGYLGDRETEMGSGAVASNNGEICILSPIEIHQSIPRENCSEEEMKRLKINRQQSTGW